MCKYILWWITTTPFPNLWSEVPPNWRRAHRLSAQYSHTVRCTYTLREAHITWQQTISEKYKRCATYALCTSNMNSNSPFVLTSILALVHLGTSTTMLYKDLCQEKERREQVVERGWESIQTHDMCTYIAITVQGDVMKWRDRGAILTLYSERRNKERQNLHIRIGRQALLRSTSAPAVQA